MKFSIIIPIYNCEQYLRECLDSVRNQTFPNWECICVDDGSTDKSGQIIDDYALLDSRFQIIHKTNGGEGSARNAGLDIFTGDWVYFLDSDDILNNQTLEVCHESIKKYPDVDLSSIRMIKFSEKQEPTWDTTNAPVFECSNIRTLIDYRAFGLPVWSVAYKATLLKQQRFSNLKIGADRVFIFNIIETASKIVYCSYKGYAYRSRIGSAVNSPMTALKFISDLKHRLAFVDIISTSKKTYSTQILQHFAKDFTEYMANCFFKMSASDQTQCLNQWCKSITNTSISFPCNVWRKLTMRLVGKSKSRMLIWVCWFLPYWLKRHGINKQLLYIKHR